MGICSIYIELETVIGVHSLEDPARRFDLGRIDAGHIKEVCSPRTGDLGDATSEHEAAQILTSESGYRSCETRTPRSVASRRCSNFGVRIRMTLRTSPGASWSTANETIRSSPDSFVMKDTGVGGRFRGMLVNRDVCSRITPELSCERVK